MFRLSGLFCIAFAILTGVLLFQTSQSVQRAEQGLGKLQNSVMTEKESLRVLTAEWDYLNRPERLEKLTLENLDLDEVQSTKTNFINDDENVPEPVIPVIPQVKPSNLLQYVSTKKGEEENETKSSIIKQPETKSFDKLMQKKSGGQE